MKVSVGMAPRGMRPEEGMPGTVNLTRAGGNEQAKSTFRAGKEQCHEQKLSTCFKRAWFGGSQPNRHPRRAGGRFE